MNNQRPVTPREQTAQANLVERLILQGVDYSTAEDKAFMLKDEKAEGVAHGGMEATVKALALVLGTDEAHATGLILNAL